MIDTEQTIVVGAPIDRVWDFARDIRAWAKLMPGLQECDLVDEDDSRWTLKVGAGALVRTVNVLVHVDRWAGPGHVDFSYALERDPVKGGGFYAARALAPDETEITLRVRVEGTGPMAPMWEALGKPLLPKFARGFAEQFKAEVEQAAAAVPGKAAAPAAATPTRPSIVTSFWRWLRRLFGNRNAGATR
jgi:carbon monoxide dehydrogenase subunit G